MIMDDAVFCVLFDRNTANVSTNKVRNYPLGPTPAVGVSQVWKAV